MRLVTPAQTRELEAHFRDELGLPLYALMEAAGGAVAAGVVELKPRRVVVVCGKGNNGGDGLVAARRLRDAGFEVEVRLVSQNRDYRDDARLALDAWLASGGRTQAQSAGHKIAPGPGTVVVVDALLGTGLDRAPEGAMRRAIRAVNQARSAGAKVVAVDVPSGLDTAKGSTPGECVQADVTVTFSPLKLGLLHDRALEPVGELHRVDIGIPTAPLADSAAPKLTTLEVEPLVLAMGPRPKGAFKNSFGHVLVIGGMPGRSGALALAGLSALRAGAGLVTVASREAEVRAAQAFAPELMGLVLEGTGPLGHRDLEPLQSAMKKMQAAVVGPGLAVGPETGALVRALAGLGMPIVVDADGLNSLGVKPALGANVVVTPHPGEASRLLGVTSDAVQADRLAAVSDLRAALGATVVLKGARTLVAGEEGTSICLDGSVKLATAGSGDVLCGLVSAMLARRRLDLQSAAELAVGIHARLGSAYPSRASLVATDLVQAIPEVMASLGL